MVSLASYSWPDSGSGSFRLVNNWDITYTLPDKLVINLSKNTAWHLGTNIELHETEKGKTFTTVRNDNHVANDDTNNEIDAINRLTGQKLAPNTEMMGTRLR